MLLADSLNLSATTVTLTLISPNKIKYQVVNVSDISRLFPQGGEVTPASLVKVGAIRKGQPVKVLGFGEITVKVTVVADKFSESASSKIAAAGGSIKAL